MTATQVHTKQALVLRRRLRVVIYARYSTEEQDVSSIADQIQYCKDYLAMIGVEDPQITIFTDEAISGELRNRPGVDQIWRGIDRPDWDLLICEDCSRLFRNESACIELVETAYDNGMRAIFINDSVDTDEEGWEQRLREAAGDHQRANHFLRRRLYRKTLGLWKMGAAVTMLRPGYRRNPTVPASMGEPAKGPFFDELDPRWVPIVRRAFEMIADGQPCWIVAEYLTKEALPKYCNSVSSVWTEKEVISLIHQTVYRGLDLHRIKIVKKKKRSGESQMIWNPEECWQREMEHQRVVSDHLWYRANAAIDSRKRKQESKRGTDSPLFGIPRDTRGPLSGLFVCGVCGHKMHMDGRNQGGYRCGAARRNECWNKATALRDVTHAEIGKIIGDALLAIAGTTEAMIAHVQNLYVSDEQRQLRIAELNSESRSLVQQQSRLLNLARSSDNPPSSLLDDLKTIEQRLAEIDAELAGIAKQAVEQRPEVTGERIQQALAASCSQLLKMDRMSGTVLERLIPSKIRAVPHLQFDTNKVVLRAEFDLQLVNFMPVDLLAALNGSEASSVSWAQPLPMNVDLFSPSAVPQYALRAIAMRESVPQRPMPYTKIGQQLGISKRRAFLAVQGGKKMRAAGITDPYVRLTEAPENASRWRTHEKFQCQVAS